jgi:hypothetical protein
MTPGVAILWTWAILSSAYLCFLTPRVFARFERSRVNPWVVDTWRRRRDEW